MTANRDKDADKKATLKILQKIDKGNLYKLDDKGVSWLGHGEGGGKIDEALVFGASMPKDADALKRIKSHISHLRVQHGLEVVEINGTYRITVPK
jgi:hypothetical protein